MFHHTGSNTPPGYPVLETLAFRWEAKSQDPKYKAFHVALEKGLAKINKYYQKLDNTNIYILALCTFLLVSLIVAANRVYRFSTVLHPYYKLDYIEEQWGGLNEYEVDLAAGLPNPINWTAHAREVTEKAVRHLHSRTSYLLANMLQYR